MANYLLKQRESAQNGLKSTVLSLLRVLALTMLAQTVVGVPPSAAQSTSPQEAPPPQVQQLLKLLHDPAVRTWMDQHQTPAIPTASAVEPATASKMMADRIAGLKEHFSSLAATMPRLPDEFRGAMDRLLDEHRGRSPFAVIVLIAGFLALGAGTEWLFRIATASFHERISSTAPGTTSERLRTMGLRLVVNLCGVAIFTLGSAGAFLAFDWPPLLRHVIIAYLIAVVVLRIVLVAGQFLLAPGVSAAEADNYRLVPIGDEAAQFRYRRLALFVGWLVFGWATVDVLSALGFSPGARALVAYALALGLLAIALEIVWSGQVSGTGEAERQVTAGRLSQTARAGLLSICFVLLWALKVAGLTRLLWLGVVALLLPMAIRVSKQAVRLALQPRANSNAPASSDLTAVYLDRGVQAVLMLAAALLLAYAWRLDLVEMTSRDTLLVRLARGTLCSVVILLVADLIWQVVKTMIDRRLARLAEMAPPGSKEALREARLKTLLPILRNATFALVAVVAGLMALSALGVEIGPLVAGAGIAGIAVGFGAQTLVRDIISGVFYLLDDAFRVGEYIRSGNYRGTVESLGIRSLKLRHHRGPIYTVPYGQLGAVENMSRDWVIDKMTVNVTFDTDLDKAKKIIRQIGKELSQDPEFAPSIIESLKMQGVEQFGDFAIQLRLKMMTRPGEQFAIRRKAFAMIKKAFDENGIRFAYPTVQVAGRDEVQPAAAQQALKVVQGAPAE